MALIRAREKASGKKLNRKPGHAQRKAEHEAWLESMCIKKKFGTHKKKSEKLDLGSPIKRVTSDTIPGNGSKKESITYTGDEIAGVALMHKQNYEPVRKDNKQAAVASAQMRRN